MCDGATGTVRGRTPALGGRAYGLEFSPDGKTFLTGLDNGEVRLWDAATLTPLGDPIPHPGAICQGRFSPDGKSHLDRLRGRQRPALGSRHPETTHPAPRGIKALSLAWRSAPTARPSPPGATTRQSDSGIPPPASPSAPACGTLRVSRGVPRRRQDLVHGRSSESRLFPVAPDLPDELERVATWVEVITGLRLDKQQGLIQVLDNAAWLERRERLMQLGGPPETGPDQRLDPILFGPDPTARARSFMERKQWDAAEAAFDEAMRARPFNLSIVEERGDLYAKRGLWSEAAAYYARAVQQYPDVAPLHYQLADRTAPCGRPGRLPFRLFRDAGEVQDERGSPGHQSRGLCMYLCAGCGHGPPEL